MSRRFRSMMLTVLLVAACGALLVIDQRAAVERASADVLAAEGNLKWYRGNTHTHSLWSDGDDYLEMIGLWYREHGYDFLVYSDHNVLSTIERWIDVPTNPDGQQAFEKLKARFPDNWVEERTVNGRLQTRLKKFDEVREKIGVADKFLLVMGEEITDRFKNKPVHMGAVNIQELIPPLGGNSVLETMQNNVNAVIAQRERTGKPILIHLNHPNFHYGITAEDLMRVRGENFFEVYNGHPTVHNSGDAEHASSDRLWDIMLALRLAELKMPVMYGLGTDDAHDYHHIPKLGNADPGRGWVMVLAPELSPEALIDAMEKGRFYASSGVALDKVVSSARGLEIEVKQEPGVEYTIEFVGTRKGFDATSKEVVDKEGKPVETTRIYSDDIGETFRTVKGVSGSYEFTGDELYVRARVTSSKKHPNPSEDGEFERAWAQPVVGPGAPMPE